jgi:hypothetical protein
MTLQNALSNLEMVNNDIVLAYNDIRLTDKDKMFYAMFYKQCLNTSSNFIGIDTNKEKFENVDFQDLIDSCKNLQKYEYVKFSQIGFYLVIRYNNLKFDYVENFNDYESEF